MPILPLHITGAIKNLLFYFICFLLSSLISVGFPINATAQQTPLNFKKLSQKEGLSQNTINCMLQDHNGFMWFGTDDGLNKYDGYQFTVYKHDELNPYSLSHNYIKSIMEDDSGNIWVGTIGGGLNRFDPKTEAFSHFKHDPEKGNSLSDNDVYSIFVDQAETVWVGTIGGGLNRFDSAKETFTHFRHNRENPNSLIGDEVFSIYEDRSGKIWVGTENGLDQFDWRDNSESPKFIHHQHDPNDSNSISANDVRAICEDHLGMLWIGTWGGGLNQYDRVKNTFTHFKNDRKNAHSLSNDIIYSIFEDQSKTLWVGTSNGLNRFNRDKNNFDIFKNKLEDPGSLSNSSVHCIFESRSGLLWFGTLNQVSFLLPFKKGFTNYQYDSKNPTGLGGQSVGSICESQSGIIWVGTSDEGLDKFLPAGLSAERYSRQGDMEKGVFTHFKNDPHQPQSLSNNKIRAVYEDRAGMVWVGTYGGLNRLDPKSDSITHYKHDPYNPQSLCNDRVWSVYEDRLGTLWIGTYEGIARFDRKTETFIHYKYDANDQGSLSGNYVRTIYEDRSGVLWFGTQNGLNQYVRETDSFINYQHDPNDPKSISDNHVNVIFENAAHQYWIGTHGGLNHFDRQSGSFTAYREKDGLPNDVVYGILEDKQHNLWMSTNNGISKFNPKKKTFKNYDITDGLQGNEFNGGAYCQLKSGEMIFGGINGLTLFHPDSIKENPFVPPVIITRFIYYSTTEMGSIPIEEKGISEKQSITLSHLIHILTFEFSALNYNNTAKNQYQYQLEGFIDNWMNLGTEHKLTFTNLNPGDYILKIKGSNDDGIWNPIPTELNIKILPPWWRTWWAYMLYGLIIFSSLYMAYRFQLARKLEQQEAKRLRDINQMKSQLYTNITHEFRTPLTVVIGMTELIREFVEKRAYGKIPETIDIIKRNSNSLLNLVNQILDLAKLESGNLKLQIMRGDVVLYLQFLTESFQSFADSKKLRLTFYSEVKALEMDYDPEKLLIIVSNLLSNALKFTPENGKVILHVNKIQDKKGDCLFIKVKDTGIGIDESSMPHIFDRFYQVDGSSTRGEPGTGIGLAMTKNLIELMNGQIAVNSKAGEGTEFSILLPITHQEGVVFSPETTRGHIQEKTNVFLPLNQHVSHVKDSLPVSDQSPLLLIVEDNPDIVLYLKSCLKGQYNLAIAKNGQEGIEMAITLIPDLIISDVMMPLKDGFELCDTLKQHTLTSHIPIILLTAKATIADKLKGLEYGADAYLQKPFNKKELLIRLEKLIEGRKKLQQRYSSIDAPLLEKENPASMEDAFLQQIRQVIENNITDPDFDSARLCREMGMSRSQIYRKLKALTDRSTSFFIRSVRLQKAREMLRDNDLTVSQVAYDVGFKDPSYFSRTFIEEFGVSPSEMRNQL